MASKLSLKLVLNKNTGEVLFGEAGKDFIDFLFSLLALPIGYVSKLLTKQHMVGCTGNLYNSLKNLSFDYMQPNFDRNTLLKPKMPIPMSGQNPLLLLQDAAASTKSKNYSYPHTHGFSFNYNNSMFPEYGFVSPEGVASGSDGGGGCVKGVVTCIVMDDLVVPMSTVSSISLLNKYQVRDVSALKEKVVEVGMDEGLALLKASLESKTVLTDVFGEKSKKVPVTKQTLIELALSEQLRERQEMEKKLQKLDKTMDYMERAKREEEAPLIAESFQRLVEEKILHEREQLQEIELSRQHHADDLQEKNRLARMLDNKNILYNRITSRREAEYNRLKKEREDRIRQLTVMRRQEREKKRKLLFFIKSEERLTKLREEEEARKYEEAERRNKVAAEQKAKLDEIAERQRQREKELEEKKRLRREALLGRTSEPLTRPAEQANGARLAEPVAAAASAAAPARGKYVPRYRR